MEKIRNLNSTEMKLLSYLGKTPELTNRELANLLTLKNPPYLSTLKKTLEEKQYLLGPYYQTDYGKIFRNRIRKAIAIVLFKQPYQGMLSLLRNLGCFSYVYPIEERFFRSYMVSIFDSSTRSVREIFDYLKQEGMIFHYELYLQDHQTYVIPPKFLAGSQGSPFVPLLDNLLDETRIPDFSFAQFDGTPLSLAEQCLISYYEQGMLQLTTIMKREKARGNFHTYAEWRAARERLISQSIIRPVYNIFPLPYVDCSHSFLLLRAETLHQTQEMLLNFGKEARLYKKIFLWTPYLSDRTYGVIYCISHPEFTIQLLQKLDKYEEIEEKKFFVLRKTFSLYEGKSISMEFYDPSSCTLYYPYEDYFEKIKRFVEENSW
jgi:hypothetical protein